MKLRRILAWVTDWNLCGIPALIYALFFSALTEVQGLKTVYVLIFILFVLCYPVLFVVRDVLFKGRSIAKRIFMLRVIDNETGELPSKQKLVVRNLFFFLYPLDAIFLIVQNKSLGDIATNTTVVND